MDSTCTIEAKTAQAEMCLSSSLLGDSTIKLAFISASLPTIMMIHDFILIPCCSSNIDIKWPMTCFVSTPVEHQFVSMHTEPTYHLSSCPQLTHPLIFGTYHDIDLCVQATRMLVEKSLLEHAIRQTNRQTEWPLDHPKSFPLQLE